MMGDESVNRTRRKDETDETVVLVLVLVVVLGADETLVLVVVLGTTVVLEVGVASWNSWATMDAEMLGVLKVTMIGAGSVALMTPSQSSIS
jgi:hypothetical protein